MFTEMGKYRCWVPHCPNSMKKFRKTDIRLFSFPVKDIERCRQWVKAVGYEDLVYLPKETLEYRYVCIEHFTEDDLIQTRVRTKLNLSAVPSKFAAENVPLSDELANEWPPVLEWECGEPEPRKPKPKPVRVEKVCIPCPDCQPSSTAAPSSCRKRTTCSSSSPIKAKRVDVKPEPLDDIHVSDAKPESLDDIDVSVDSEKSEDISNLHPAGLQQGDELLGFIVRRGNEIKIIQLEDESMMVAIHN